MSKSWTPKRPTVELRPSKIRRDPPPRPEAKPLRPMWIDATEWETWTTVAGVVAFAIAITIIIFGFSDFTAG